MLEEERIRHIFTGQPSLLPPPGTPSDILQYLSLLSLSKELVPLSQQNYGTFLLKTECLSILFECLTLEDLYKEEFCSIIRELTVPCWLCDPELAK